MNLRNRFPIFSHQKELVYLDSAASAHKPASVIKALTRFYAEEYATVHRAAYQSAVRATERYHNARKTAQRFLHAKKTEEIIFTRGTTDSINLVARTFPFQRGDEILVSELEHHSNLVPWQMVAKEQGLILKRIRMLPDGTLDLALPLSPKTKLIAVTHASNVTGTIVPIRSIVNLAKQVGAAVLVDGAQAAPHLPIDVEQLGIDFYAFSGHKCYGPTGIGILYGKQERLASLSCWQGGGDMVDRVEFETSSYQEAPLRFEAGTPLIGSAIGLGAALEFLEELDRSQVERWETHLQEMTREKLLKIEGLTLLGSAPRTTPLLSFSIDGIHPLDLAGYLDCKNIAIRTGHLCAQPLLSLFGLTSVARVSLGLYNTEEDIQRFSVALQEAVRVLRPRAISSVVE